MQRTSQRLTGAVALAAIGFTSSVGQLVLLRELVATFYGNELVLGWILAAWLACVAVGAWGLGRWLPRRPAVAMAAGLAAAAAILPVQIALIRASRDLLGVTPGALVAFVPMALTILLVLAPLCMLLGWLFTVGTRLYSLPVRTASEGEGRSGEHVGRPYVAESIGAVAGGALFSFVLVRWLYPFQVALGVGGLNLAVAALVLYRRSRGLGEKRVVAPSDGSQRLPVNGKPGVGARSAASKMVSPRGAWLASGVLALAAVTLLGGAWPLGGRLQNTTLRWQYDGLRFARDSIYARLAVTGAGEQRVFFENGLLFFETQGVSAEEVAHLPLLAHPQPRRVLFIGGGVSGTLVEALRHPSVEVVHYVELDPLVVTAARRELPPDQAAILDDPRVTLAHVDGRRYVRQQTGALPFDVIILDLPEPATGQLNRFYTQEFFAEVRAVLSPGGVFALGLPWQENLAGPALRQLAASVYHTAALEYPEITPLPAGRLFLLASDEPLPTDPAIWKARLAKRGIVTRWVVPSYLDYLFTTDRVTQVQRVLETEANVPVNHDLEPICYFYDLAVWLSRFYGRLGRLAAGMSPLRLGWLVLPLALIALLLRRWPMPAAVACIGLAEMMLQVVVLFAFQVVHGYVYGQVGLIVTAFMAGLALGGAVANRWRWSAEEEGRAKWRAILPHHSPRATLAWVLAAIVLLALGFLWVVKLAPPVWVFPLLAMAAGGLVGLAFPVAVACVRGETSRVAGLLYGADLVGGWLGAVVASSLLIPLLGIPQTCLVVALVGLMGLGIVV